METMPSLPAYAQQNREVEAPARLRQRRGRTMSTPDRNGLGALDRVLGVRFKDAELRETALTHRSYAFENELTTNNERLEFLGDAVLGIVVTDMAFCEFPDMPEGELAKLRAAIVSEI
jgi:ribonuclease-3